MKKFLAILLSTLFLGTASAIPPNCVSVSTLGGVGCGPAQLFTAVGGHNPASGPGLYCSNTNPNIAISYWNLPCLHKGGSVSFLFFSRSHSMPGTQLDPNIPCSIQLGQHYVLGPYITTGNVILIPIHLHESVYTHFGTVYVQLLTSAQADCIGPGLEYSTSTVTALNFQ